MQGYLSQVSHLQSGFGFFNLSQVPRSRNTHVDSLATLATSSAQSLPKVILVEDLCKPTKEKGSVVHVHQIRVGPSWMNLIVLFLKDDVLLKSSPRLKRYGEKLLDFSYPRTKSCTKDPFLAYTCYVYTLKQLSHSWKNYMKGFVEATQGADLYLIGPLHKVIGGRICRKEPRNM